ncbi:TRAP-T-associated universal stress protein TeaD [Comamonas sp. PE63]|uniref:TRAP-T-associated universal stress protein TeaD n=1 Tax=Comamonas brasiliensis TaxID=1812482 RepID=A0ABS5M0T4_9BURK|nr:universal stress protein [Comamonas sp. PE63]MBS3022026.1 TRAP-T-associated universal stress protein TeaD [Comamonas sp. PE63]
MLKIMLAVDGSDVALEAVRHGIKLLQSGLDAHFVIAHVQKEASLLELATTDSDLIANASIEAGMDLVAPAQDLLKEAGASYEVEISLGEEANTLIDIAESNECDQIIIGATGQSGLGSILIGSVSREVARHSRLPVTIVKMPEVAELDEGSDEEADA